MHDHDSWWCGDNNINNDLILSYGGSGTVVVVVRPIHYSTVTFKKLSYQHSPLLNFFVTTFPGSIPNLSQILCPNSGWEVPAKTLMLGIPLRSFKVPEHWILVELNMCGEWWLEASVCVWSKHQKKICKEIILISLVSTSHSMYPVSRPAHFPAFYCWSFNIGLMRL